MQTTFSFFSEPIPGLIVEVIMKVTCILFLLVFSLNSLSQDTLATVLRHDWAAGQCCSGGTDITFTLSDQLSGLDFDSLVYISSGSSRVVLYPTDFHAQVLKQKAICTLTYGWSTTNHGSYDPSMLTVNYGLPENRFTIVTNQRPHLLIYTKNGKVKQAFVNEQFTITAYP